MGIVVGCVAFAIASVVVAVLLYKKRVRARQREADLFADPTGEGGGDYVAM